MYHFQAVAWRQTVSYSPFGGCEVTSALQHGGPALCTWHCCLGSLGSCGCEGGVLRVRQAFHPLTAPLSLPSLSSVALFLEPAHVGFLPSEAELLGGCTSLVAIDKFKARTEKGLGSARSPLSLSVWPSWLAWHLVFWGEIWHGHSKVGRARGEALL